MRNKQMNDWQVLAIQESVRAAIDSELIERKQGNELLDELIHALVIRITYTEPFEDDQNEHRS